MIIIILVILTVLLLSKLMSWAYPRIKGNNLMLTASDPSEVPGDKPYLGELLVFGSDIVNGKSSKDYSFVDGLSQAGYEITLISSEHNDCLDYLNGYLAQTKNFYDGVLIELPDSQVQGSESQAEALSELLLKISTDHEIPVVIFSLIRLNEANLAYENLIQQTWELKKNYNFVFSDFWHNQKLSVAAGAHYSLMLSNTEPTIAGQQSLYLPRIQVTLAELINLEQPDYQPISI